MMEYDEKFQCWIDDESGRKYDFIITENFNGVCKNIIGVFGSLFDAKYHAGILLSGMNCPSYSIEIKCQF